MSIELEYLIYCIEEYKRRHGTNGKETYQLFEQSGASQYIIAHYDALHTAGILTVRSTVISARSDICTPP